MPDQPSDKNPTQSKDDLFARILDSLVDLLETVRAVAAAVLLVIALIFLAVAAVIALGNLIGYAWTFFAIGMVYLIGSVVFLVIKVRAIQR
jgi:hypothetical protein